MLFPDIFIFSWFSNFVRFGLFQKCSKSHLLRSSQKMTVSCMYHTTQIRKKHVSHHPNPKISVWPFLDLLTLTLHMLTESLGWRFEISQTRSMLFYWSIHIWCGCSVWQNQICQIVKHFYPILTSDVIGDPEVNNIGFPIINFPDLSKPFEFCKSAQ